MVKDGIQFNKFWKRYRVILVIYSIFTLLIFYVAWLEGPKRLYLSYGKQNEWVPGLLFGILKVSGIYYFLIYQFALPFVRSNNWKIFFYRLLPFFIVLTAIEYLIDFQMGKPTIAQRMNNSIKEFLIWEIVIACFMVLFTISIAIYMELQQKKAREAELEKQKLNAELAAIKYQINPHFLFNSLSFIYTKSVKQDMEIAKAVALLSEVMRYALELEEDAQGKVPLSKEIHHMKNVLEMNQMRYNNALYIEYAEEVDDYNERIPPLVLITLVENAFKHGDLNDPQFPLIISLTVKQKVFRFCIGNKKKMGSKELSSGIGLDNVKQRLELTYGKRQMFNIKGDDHYFISEIIISL